jgi:hypothetical protein
VEVRRRCERLEESSSGVWGGVEREPMPSGVNEHDVLDFDVDFSAAIWSSGLLGRDAVSCNNDWTIVEKSKVQGQLGDGEVKPEGGRVGQRIGLGK